MAPNLLPLQGGEFNWCDLAALVLLVLFVWHGFQRGAIRWLAGVGAWILSLALSFALAPIAAGVLAGHSGPTGVIGERVAFFVLLVIIRIVLGWAMQELVSSLRPLLRAIPPLDLLDHLLGIIPSAALGFVLVVALISVALFAPVGGRVHEAAIRSYLGHITTAEIASVADRVPRNGLLAEAERMLGQGRAALPN